MLENALNFVKTNRKTIVVGSLVIAGVAVATVVAAVAIRNGESALDVAEQVVDVVEAVAAE